MFDFSIFDSSKGASKESLLEQKRKQLEGKNLDKATKSYLDKLNNYSIDKLFKDYDKDGNGFITTDEASLIKVDFTEDSDDSEEISKEDFLKMDFPNLQGADLGKIFEYLDGDGDGLISKAELENLTLKEIQNFSIPTEDALEETPAIESTDFADAISGAPVDNAFDAGTGGDYQSGGNYSGSSNNSPQGATLEQQIKELEASKSDVQSKAETAIAQEEANLKEIINQDEKLAELKDEYETESKRIGEELTAANTELTESQNALSDTEVGIEDKTNRITYKTEQISGLESSISDKKSALNSISTSTGNEETDKANADKKASLEQEIKRLEDRLSEAKDEKIKLEEELEALNGEKTKLKEKISELTEKITDLEGQKNELLDKIAEKASPETKQAIAESREKIEKIKTDSQKEIQDIDGKIKDLKTQLNSKALEKEKSADKIADMGYLTELVTDEDFAAYGFTSKDKIEKFKKLTPEMQAATVDLMNYARANGIEMSITSSYRSNAEQIEIYKTARPGYAAKPGNSPHEFGLAIDINIPGSNGNDKNDPKYKLLGEYWLSQGHRWGGTWTGANEPWHFDIKNG